MKNGCISNRIVTFHISRHFPLNHYGRKSMWLPCFVFVTNRSGSLEDPTPVFDCATSSETCSLHERSERPRERRKMGSPVDFILFNGYVSHNKCCTNVFPIIFDPPFPPPNQASPYSGSPAWHLQECSHLQVAQLQVLHPLYSSLAPVFWQMGRGVLLCTFLFGGFNQPIWKICSSKWVHLPQVGDENKKYLKPPPSFCWAGRLGFIWVSGKFHKWRVEALEQNFEHLLLTYCIYMYRCAGVWRETLSPWILTKISEKWAFSILVPE